MWEEQRNTHKKQRVLAQPYKGWLALSWLSVWCFDVLLSNTCSQLENSVVWKLRVVNAVNMQISDWDKTKVFLIQTCNCSYNHYSEAEGGLAKTKWTAGALNKKYIKKKKSKQPGFLLFQMYAAWLKGLLLFIKWNCHFWHFISLTTTLCSVMEKCFWTWFSILFWFY